MQLVEIMYLNVLILKVTSVWSWIAGVFRNELEYTTELPVTAHYAVAVLSHWVTHWSAYKTISECLHTLSLTLLVPQQAAMLTQLAQRSPDSLDGALLPNMAEAGDMEISAAPASTSPLPADNIGCVAQAVTALLAPTIAASVGKKAVHDTNWKITGCSYS